MHGNRISKLARWVVVLLTLGMVACGGGGGDGSSSSSASSAVSTYTVGGTVASLNGTLGLQNNGGNDLSLTTNGGFTFTTAIASGGTYAVTVKTQPTGQACSVSNGSGTIANSNVTNVAVSCITAPVITSQPAGVTVTAGQTATFSVVASGTAPLTYQWQRDGTNIVNATAASYTTAATVVGDTNAHFSVVISNSAGTVTSSAAVLTVNAVVAQCGSPNGTVVTHSSDISTSETWAGDGVTHNIPYDIAINGTAILTIQPCALVTLGQGASITVKNTAKLLAAGTSDTRFVYFLRADANQPWGILRAASATSLIELHWTIVLGGGAFGGQYHNPGIAAAGTGYGYAPSPVLKVDNVIIQSPQGVGVYLDANAAFTDDSQELVISGGGDYAVMTTMMSLGSLPSGSYTGNAVDEILIIGPNTNVFADMTIHDRGIPVRIQIQSMSVAPMGASITPVTLTIEPGVVLKFPKMSQNSPGARVSFGGNGNSPNNGVGVLNAIGTPTKPIVFTSGEAVPAPGDWIGLWLDTANGSRLDYVEISYAGASSGISSNNCKPTGTFDNAALFVGDFETQYVPPSNLITNSIIRNSAGYGIDAIWQTTSFNSPNLTVGNLFQNNAMCAQTYNGLAPPGTCPTQRGCTAN